MPLSPDSVVKYEGKFDQNYKGPFDGKCHCGSVQFRVNKLTTRGLQSVSLCDCSICVMRTAYTVSVPMGELCILKGADCLSLYQFNTDVAKHYFCSKCGIYTHHQCRSDPNILAVNVACLEGLSPFDFLEAPVLAGAAHHPNEVGPEEPKWQWKGVLRFVPNK